MECIRFNEENTELGHRINIVNIDICCIQETHQQKDKTLNVSGDRRKGGIITLIKSNINAYMSSSSNDGAEQYTVTDYTLKEIFYLSTTTALIMSTWLYTT